MMIIRVCFLRCLFILLLFFCSCSTFKIADRYTSNKLSKNGLHLKELKTENFTISYWDSGGDKPVLVLLHGFGAATQFQWYQQVETLKDSFRLILPNLIYFGGSVANPPISSVNDQVKAMQVLIDQLGFNSFSLCGVSYGGLVAAELGLINQNRVKKLIICDAPVKFMDGNDIELICKKFHVNSLSELLVPDEYKKLKTLLKIAYRKPPEVPVFMFKSVYKNLYMKYAPEQKELLKSLESEKELYAQKTYHYQFPVLLIWGAEDELIPVSVGKKLQEHIGSETHLEIIPKTAHMPAIEEPEIFNKILHKFLEQ